ncbi:MAG TPA: hypothetical protein VKG25_14425 [Bryobacteraceae bacterium]|nr:hypothetical protein [Bryobacteraceae bacterium]
MAYADDLLVLAAELAGLHQQTSHQASLRRAVSTAYYALFHLLIAEATANWSRPELRPLLARVFDHGPMKQAADKKVSELNSYFKEKPPDGPERRIAVHLYNVADTFAQAQHHRNEADYNVAREWEPAEVVLHIDGVAEAFNSWNTIRENPVAQAYLVSLLPSKERRQNEKPRSDKRPT